MDRFAKYAIPFVGLTKGSHQYHYDIDGQLFELFENPAVHSANVGVDLDFNKSDNVLTLTFTMKGTLRVTCDRCLEEFDLPIDSTHIMLVRFGEPGVGETDDIIVIGRSESQVNVAQHIYDYLSLDVPIRVVHPDNEDGTPGCNPEFLDKLINKEDEEPKGDPRWEVLKKLGLNKN